MKSFIVAAVVGLVSATVIAAPASAAGKRGGMGGMNPGMMTAMAPIAIAAGTALIGGGALDDVGTPVLATPSIAVPVVTPGLPIILPGITLPGGSRGAGGDIGG